MPRKRKSPRKTTAATGHCKRCHVCEAAEASAEKKPRTAKGKPAKCARGRQGDHKGHETMSHEVQMEYPEIKKDIEGVTFLPRQDSYLDSAKLREEGNQLFLSVKDGLAPILKVSRLEQAISKYTQASYHAKTTDEKASALKNIATASVKLAKMLNTEKELLQVQGHFKIATASFSEAYNWGLQVKSDEWQQKTMLSLHSCLEELETTADALPFQKKMSLMENCIYALEIDSLRAEFCLKVAEMFFHDAVNQLDEKDYKQSLARIHDCYRPTEEAAKSGKRNPTIVRDVRVRKEDLRFHTCTAESLQAVSIGDNLWKEYFNDGSDGDKAMAWEILDWYKMAVLKTREVEVEMEAIALSRIGKLYDQVLGLRSKARENFKRAIQLALSLHPRTFNNDEWYKLCTETLEKYQKEQVEQEDQKWNAAREKYLKELEKELALIDQERKKGDVDLLTWVYKTHPPKNKEHALPDKLPEVDRYNGAYHSEMKSLLKKAVVHYHPDRCDVEVHGEKWKVLCEEICKRFTQRYESFK